MQKLTPRELNTVIRLLKDERRILTDRVYKADSEYDKVDLAEVNEILRKLEDN